MDKLPKTMKAVVFTKANSALKVVTKSLPEPKEGELLVKVKGVSVCASDFVPWKGYLGDVDGLTAGHEGVGTVVAAHGASTGFNVGDKIGFINTAKTCNHCEPCRSGRGQFCGSGKNQGFNIDGFFSEYAIVEANLAVRIAEDLPLERLSPLFCAGITAFRAVKQLEAPARGIIGVFGLGGVGTFALRFALAMGFTVWAFDVSADARKMAERLGAAKTFDSSNVDVITDEVKQATEGRLLDGAVAAAGVVPAYDAAVKLTGFFKTVVAVGVPREPIQIDSLSLIKKGLVIKGTLTGSGSDLDEMMRLVRRHRIIPEIELGTLEDIPDSFLRCASGNAGAKLGAILS